MHKIEDLESLTNVGFELRIPVCGAGCGQRGPGVELNIRPARPASPGIWFADDGYTVLYRVPVSDVDTPEPDEKSIITYVSQLYDVFPEPPPGHPLFDAEAQKKFEQFKELASSLHQWIREHITIMQVSLTQSDTQHQPGPAANIDNQ